MKSKSTYLTALFCSLTIFSWLILTQAHPVDSDETDLLSDSFGFSSNELPKGDFDSNEKGTTTRPKRTIGFLRDLFPGLSQLIDRKIQQITRVIFRVVGRLILRNPGGGNGANGRGSGNSRNITIVLPTYPAEPDEEETDAPTANPELDIRFGDSGGSSGQTNSSSTPSTDANSTASSTEASSSTDSAEANRIIRKVRDVSDTLAETTPSLDDEPSSSESSTRRPGLLGRLGLEMRKKRGSLGSGSGSGNFLFDLIRLIAGSGVSPEKDEELNAPRDERDENTVDSTDSTSGTSDNSEDNYSAGIPGPLTRLFVIANRGISNLIQDLILRLAQTSERIVNFKARLITAII